MEPLLLVIGALAAIVVAALLSRRTGVATPLVLLVVGLGAGLVPAVPDVVLHPEVVLAGVLPPLLYATAVKVPVVDLRRNLSMISWLSITLVLASAVAIGALVHLVVPEIPFAAGVALGAVVSPTDAVAATAVGKRLGLPHRIMTVLEGESLFNDATALVLLRTALAALLGSFSLGDAVVEFFRALIVAIVVGLLIGWATVRLRARLADPVLTTAVSFVVPFLAYLPAEALDASGVVSVVVAGIVTGHMGAHRFSARERSTEQTNWTTLQFLVENGVFLLMGLQLPDLLADVQRHHEPLPTIALLTVALVLVLLLLRVLFVGVQVLAERSRRRRLGERREQVDRVAERVDGFADQAGDSQREQRRLSMMLRRVAQGRADLDFYEREPIGARGGAVIAWAGMRGVVTLAAAQTIPAEVETRSMLVAIAFGVAALSLLGYGGTLPRLIRATGITRENAQEVRDELDSVLDELLQRAGDQVGRPEDLMIEGEPVAPAVLERVQAAMSRLGRARDDLQRPEALSERQQAAVLQRRYLDALREGLREERAVGAYSTRTLQRVERLLDAEELRLDGPAPA